MTAVWKGKGAVPGLAMGQIRLAGIPLAAALAKYVPAAERQAELGRLAAAQDAVAGRLRAQAAGLAEAGQQVQADVLAAQQLLVQDPMLTASMQEKTRADGHAPRAILAAAEEAAAVFEAMEDAYLRERAADVRAAGQMIARQLLGIVEPPLGEEPVILAGESVEAAMLATIPAEKLAGVVLGEGSLTSHAVILARARALPTVVGLGIVLGQLKNGDEALLDGEQGTLLLHPSPEQLAQGRQEMQQQQVRWARYAELRGLPGETQDGVRVQLLANIGVPAELEPAFAQGAEGVGLFRSEFLFLGRETIPTEEEQYAAYRAAVERCQGKTCVIRTMDIGGDKPLPYLHIPTESNPYLGWRAIRISLEWPELFQPQLRALLRASAHGPVAIMLPMVVNAAEIEAVREQVGRTRAELTAKGIACAAKIPLGIMIETPAAAVMADVLAKHADFFSIGTNDLTQYVLAADRGNAHVAQIYNPFHPAVLRLIRRTIQAGQQEGIPVDMCGEMAGNPYAAVLLIAMGISGLSMSAASIPRVKEKLRSITVAKARELLAAVLEMEDAVRIEQYLREALG